MKQRTALKSVFGISIAGLLFSGYLSYTELFAQCNFGCSPSSSIAGVPVCVYGFVMYLALAVISIIGLNSGKKEKR